MQPNRPILLHTLQNRSTGEIRRLILDRLDGSSVTQLVQFGAGPEIPVGKGTEFEMTERGDELTREWVTDEGYRRVPDNELVWETKDHIVPLLLRMGYKGLYDESSKSISPGRQPLNLTGAVPLQKWPGLSARNGGEYRYAFDGQQLHANPTLPPHLRPS